jgi:GT2 family glycosyltransferase
MSIVIVNWNTGTLLQKCVQSILENQCDLNLEIIVIDNASSDDSMSGTSEFPEIVTVFNNANVGFAKANNQGFRIAGGRFILMLNPDTVVRPNALGRMLRFMDANPKVGALGPRLLNPDGSLQPSCSYFPSLTNLLIESLALNRAFSTCKFFARPLMTAWTHDVTQPVDQPSGACLLLRRSALQEVGVLDDRFFVYLEEVDLCYRLKRAGWSIYFLAEAEIIHYGGQSSLRNLDVRIVQRYRSLLRYYAKHFSAKQVVLARVLVMIQMLLRICTLPLLKRHLSTHTIANLTNSKLLHYYFQVVGLCISKETAL